MTSQLEAPARAATVTITNPVLRGFNPDPSILRVGEDYYLATSTFQWYPGVAIYHSRDLVRWRPVAQPASRTSMLDMRGNSDSGGVWAPALSHDGERFHLIYSDVKSWGANEVFKDAHNYLTTAENIEGPWSEPIYMNSSGFDPSLFHDIGNSHDTDGSTMVDAGGDGRKWFVNMKWDHRQGRNKFSGIVMQEYSPQEQRLIGSPEIIFTGTELGVTEAPHLFRKGGWYYLLTAEGGTSWEHAVTLARSRSLHGPYEVHPQNPLMTAVDDPTLPIQKSGHASFTNTPDGQWIIAYLCGRPLTEHSQTEEKRCPLGRETSLQALVWGEDGWPRLASGGHHPVLHAELPALPPHPWPEVAARDEFDGSELRSEWMTLRGPAELMGAELTGHSLKLTGRESMQSRHHLALVGRRLQSLDSRFRTALSFDPEDFQQMAGVTAYYDSRNWVYLRLSRDAELGRTLALLQCENGEYRELLSAEIAVGDTDPVDLGIVYGGGEFWFEYSLDGGGWQQIGGKLSAGLLSDEHCGGLSFTGTFLALTCQDMSGRKQTAEFHWAEYLESE